MADRRPHALMRSGLVEDQDALHAQYIGYGWYDDPITKRGFFRQTSWPCHDNFCLTALSLFKVSKEVMIAFISQSMRCAANPTSATVHDAHSKEA